MESQYGKGSIFHFTIPQRIWPISEQKKAGAEISKVSDEEAEMLPVIGGLNVSEGTKNCGSKKLFLELLGDFYKLIELKSTKLEKCLADGMIKDYTIEVHALKNTARMIGAMELSDLFYQMEQLEKRLLFAPIHYLEPKSYRKFIEEDMYEYFGKYGLEIRDYAHCDYTKVITLQKTE